MYSVHVHRNLLQSVNPDSVARGYGLESNEKNRTPKESLMMFTKRSSTDLEDYKKA